MGKLLGSTNRVMFEINNQCVYSPQHRKCPVHLNKGKGPQTLPEKIIYNVFDFMAEEGFEGRVSFHNYNDPMTDPRLFMFIDRLKKTCPKCYVFIMTNAWNLDQEMLNELQDHGVMYIEASAYNERESTRTRERVIRPEGMTYRVMTKKALDDRMDIYANKESECKESCYAPLAEIIIRSNGDVGLCCFEWAGKVTFGNLHEQSLKEILQAGKMLSVYEKLKKGQREFPVCRRCNRRREVGDWEHRYGQDKQ